MSLPFNKARTDAQPETIYTFPYVSWRHGKKALKPAGGISYTGGFMVAAKDIQGQIPEWSLQEIVTKKGDVTALCASPAKITILRYRERWEKKENGKSQSTLHAVGFIKGYDDPVCFVVTGIATSWFKTILREHQKVAAFANKNRPQGTAPLPRYLFWVKVEADAHTSAGSGNDTSDATFPKIVLPEKFTDAYVEAVFVGEANMDRFQELFVELEPWVTQWPAPRQAEQEGGHPEDEIDAAQQYAQRRSMSAAAGNSHQPPRFDDLPSFASDDVNADPIPFR